MTRDSNRQTERYVPGSVNRALKASFKIASLGRSRFFDSPGLSESSKLASGLL